MPITPTISEMSQTALVGAVDLDLPVRQLASRDYVVLLSRERADGSPQLVRGYAFRADVTL
jgi:hypothetical protein